MALELSLPHFSPKDAEANMVKDFRLISIIHSFARLIAKILANRLAQVSGFFGGHQSQVLSSVADVFMIIICWCSRLYQDSFPAKGTEQIFVTP